MSEKVRIQDDLYYAVNGEWMEQAVIPDDRHMVGGFADLDKEVEELLMKDFAAFLKGEKQTELPEMKEAVKLYEKVLNVEKRNAEGISPVLPTLKTIQSIRSISDLNANALNFLLEGIRLPVDVGVSEDMQDATKHSFIISGQSTILPDTTYYAPENPAGKQLLEVYSQMARKILAFTPLTNKEQEVYLADTLSFDEKLAKQVKSRVEWADYVKNHNPMPLDEVQTYLAPFDLKGLLSAYYGKNVPEIVVVYDPKAIKNFKEYFNAENVSEFMHWCYVCTLLSATKTLSLELKELGGIYSRALTGVQKDPEIEKQAYRVAAGVFSEPVGVYYGRTYFGEEAKKDITKIVEGIVKTYQKRIRENTFLAESTKEKAIKKLSTMAVKMGYPDSVRPFYSQIQVAKEDSYYATMQKITSLRVKENLDKLLKKVDRSEWAMPGHMVNACYNPSANDITFPAAILQKPFYSLHQSVSENLGGIGAVIGHEISHAFDNNGAQFDENGNLFRWWTDEDFKSFQDLTEKMKEQFDGIEFHGGRVNGELVVSENIADNGGMAVTLDLMGTIENPDYSAYFQNWAKVWCRKAREEIIQYLLVNDVHSPAELRANMQPRNFSEWYQTFSVTKEDKMYLPEEKRIIIW